MSDRIAREAAAHEAGGLRAYRLGALPRQSLLSGDGTVRDLWVEQTQGLTLRWQLQLVELRRAGGTMQVPAGSRQLVVGVSGPQVSVGPVQQATPLRREQALPLRSTVIEFHRPRLRVSGVSLVLVLTLQDPGLDPEFRFQTLHGETELDAATRAILVLKGSIRSGQTDVREQSIAILRSQAADRVRAESARVLTLVMSDAAQLHSRDRAGSP